MRPLNFRIWDKTKKEMLHYDGIRNPEKSVLDLAHEYPELVMLSLDILDENDNELFDGDYITFEEKRDGFNVIRIECVDPTTGFNIRHFKVDFTIIGNVFEGLDY